MLSCIPPLLFVIVLFPFDCPGTWLIQVPQELYLSHYLYVAGFRLQRVDRDLEGEMKLTASSAGLPAKLPPLALKARGAFQGI